MCDVTLSSSRRSYGGRSAEQRRETRRTALLDAGRDLWCEQGWAAVTMRGVCARAALTDRYFYESFSDRDALLVAVGEAVRDETIALLLAAVVGLEDEPPAVQLRAALEAIIDHIANDPGSSQIFFGDHGGSDVLEALRREMIGAVVSLFIELTRPHLLPNVDENEVRLALFVGIGGFVEAVSAWRSGILDATNDGLIEMLMGVSRRLGQGLVDLG